MKQLELIEMGDAPSATPTPRARREDSETSHEAAASVGVRTITQTHDAIIYALGVFGPSTDEEIQERLSQGGVFVSPSGARTRRSELVERGKVVFDETYGTTASGRRTRRWRLPTPK